MKYSPPRVFPNDILTQYVTPTPKSKETVLGEIQQLIPFLTWDENLEKAVLTPKKETKKSAKATPPEPNPNESASDEAFFALMPVNKGGEPDG